ncbi:hypothetical protein ACFKHW_37655 [Bradyrhizobium lupini]|uniref:hypothetical protein n=1 Tax=Rhizobium lupini TaxID=136996 RepID=UPI003672D086
MLDAYLRKGAALPTEPALAGHRRVIEDAITSTLLTPVRFMCTQDAIRILSLLVGSAIEQPNACNLILWPKYRASPSSSNAYFVEPDVVVDLHYQDRVDRIVIEIKWDDVLHLNQVRSQLESAATDLESPDSVRHFCLVKFADVEVFQSKITTVRQWSEVLKDLRQAASETNQAGASDASIDWCYDAVKLLERLGIGSFVGLGTLSLVPLNRAFSFALRRFAWADLNAVRPNAKKCKPMEGF